MLLEDVGHSTTLQLLQTIYSSKETNFHLCFILNYSILDDLCDQNQTGNSRVTNNEGWRKTVDRGMVLC